MFKEQMMKHCCGDDGDPDLDKMRGFMERHDKASMLDTASWALFFLWVGGSWIANLGVGVGLIGVAVITLGSQLVRKLAGLTVEWFWVVVGLLIALWGIWELNAIQVSLIPVLMIIVGLVLAGMIGRQWFTPPEPH